MKTVSEYLKSQPFHPEVENKKKVTDVLKKEYVLLDAKIMNDWQSSYGKAITAFMLLGVEGTEEKTVVITSGLVIVKQLEKLRGMRAFPCKVTFTEVVKQNGDVYHIMS